MKFLLTYKLFESGENPTRTTSLTQEKFISLLRKNCTEWLSNPVHFFRHKRNRNYDYSYLNPKSFIRNSIGNYGDGLDPSITNLSTDTIGYINIITNHLWVDFPKRDKSIIGILNNNIVNFDEFYGEHIYLIIPYDNSMVVSCPRSDLWHTYINGEAHTMGMIADSLHHIETPYETYDVIINHIVERVNKYYSNVSDLDDSIFVMSLMRNYLDLPPSGESVDFDLINDRIEELFNIYNINELNDGKLTLNKVSELKNINHTSEVWTDGECLIYYLGDNIEDAESSYNALLRNLGI